MNDEQEIQQEAGLSENWRVIDSAPIVMQKAPMGPGAQIGPGNYFAGPTDPTLQHDSDATKSKIAGGANPEYSLMPTGAANAPNNAAIKSVITQTLGEITKTVASSTAAAFTPCTKVNYQTTGDYTVQLSDLAGIISIGNSAGGVITLPSPTSGAAPGTLVQAAYGSGSASLTNTSGNGMIAVVFTSPNVTLGTVSVTDSAGNVWIPITTNSGDSELMCTFYCAKVPGGHNTVTAVVPFFPPPPPPSQVPFFTFIAVYEVAGLVPNGLDQFANGVGSGNASISPTTSSTVAFTFAQATSLTPTNPTPGSGWTGVTPPLPILGWNYPAYAGGMLGGYWVGLAEYILNPAKGVAISGTASGGAIADSDVTMANFAIAPNASAAGFTSCWYTWIENTGTGSYYLESASTIDGSVDSVLIGPNEGLMVVYDGTNWVTERGLGGGGGSTLQLEVNGIPNGDQELLNLAAGTGIGLADNGSGTVTVTNTLVTGTPQNFWAWPLSANGSSSANMNPVATATMNFSGNNVALYYLHIDVALTISNFTYNIVTGDATAGHFYDWGMYSESGTLIWNLGAISFPSTGQIMTPLAQGTVTIQPGNYWLAFTGNHTGLSFQAATSSSVSEYWFFAFSASTVWWTSSTTSTGGTLTGLTVAMPSIPTATSLTAGAFRSYSGDGVLPLIALTT